VSRAGESLEALLALMARLRDPQRGCPWDRAQTFASIAPFTIEEAYEVADAIERGDPQQLRAELGDLLFQIVFHARLAEERGWFGFADVAEGIHAKLTERHPHVFGETQATDQSQLAASWETAKAAERSARGAAGVLADLPVNLPALSRAEKLTRRAARVGFDWPDAQAVVAKIHEEIGEVQAAAEQGGPAELQDEIGDLLFAVVNWARHHRIDAEAALRQAGHKFERRFAHMEALAGERGWPLARLSAAQWEALWSEAKRAGMSSG